MSASLVVLIPVVLLGVVGALSFVGCVLQAGGLHVDAGPYRDLITNYPSLKGFWPLDDTKPSDNSVPVALDDASHPPGQNPFNGQYIGTFNLQQMGIALGDVSPGVTGANRCASFNGGRVEVPFKQDLNDSLSFTLECWVRPNWTSSGTQQAVAASAFVDERPSPSANAGYALVATPDNYWSAQIGIGTTFIGAKSDQAITLGEGVSYYLAMSLDSKGLTLFVGIVGGSLTPTLPMALKPGEKFMSEAPGMTATSLFIGMGRPDIPTTNQYPFNGSIQDVAYYSPALTVTDIQNNFGLGSKPPA